MARRVLLSYGDRNKPITIPPEVEEAVPYIKKQFLKDFDFAPNVKLRVTLQTFQDDWNEFVDIDDDALISSKEKLKVVVTPLLSSDTSQCSAESNADAQEIVDSKEKLPSHTANDEEVSISSGYPELSTSSRDDCPSIIKPPHKRKKIIISDSSDDECEENKNEEVDSLYESESATDSIPMREGYSINMLPDTLCKAIKKEKNDCVPLPDPFPFPKNYRPDVEACLSSKKMTSVTRAKFYTSIAHAMFQYTRQPSRDDCTSVARQIVAKYPFLAAQGIGTSYGGIAQTLVDRFKEFNRKKRKTSSSHSGTSSSSDNPFKLPRKKLPGAHRSNHNLPAIPRGEDEASYQRHNRVLSQWSKSVRNLVLVEQLMSLTFPMRRREITEKGMDVMTIFTKFPFLEDSKQLLRELERISENPLTTCDWVEKWVPGIIGQSYLERDSGKLAVKQVIELADSLGWNDSLLAVAVLPFLVPDSRSKANLNKILVLIKSSTLDDVVKKGQTSPYVAVTESIELFLVVDKTVVCECTSQSVPFHLMSAFFSFHIQYTPGLHAVYGFFEHILLGFVKKVSPSVTHFIASLQQIRH